MGIRQKLTQRKDFQLETMILNFLYRLLSEILSAGIFTVFGLLVIGGQRVTQWSMRRAAHWIDKISMYSLVHLKGYYT